jgi:hypothetical protein
MRDKEKFTTSEEKIKQYINSTSKTTQIIGLYAKAKKMKFIDQLHVSEFYKRHVKDVPYLLAYQIDDIVKTMKHLIDNADYKWTLATVAKFIDEDLDSLAGKTPIIILKNGERIYDINRLKELERAGRVYYQNKRWYEH